MSTKNIFDLIYDVYAKNKLLTSSLRIYNTRSMILFYMLGLKLGGILAFNLDLLKVFIIFSLSYGSASLFNFLTDKKIDKHNKKFNPLMQKSLDKNAYKILIILCVCCSIFLGLTTQNNIIITFGALLIILLGYLYSKPPLMLSHHPFGKLASMGITYAYLPSFMGLLSGKGNLDTYIFLFFIGSVYVSWLPYSDIKDINGDKANNKRTLAVLFGPKKIIYLCLILSSFWILVILLIPSMTIFLPRNLFIFFWVLLLFQLFIFFKPDFLQRKVLQSISGYIFYLPLLLLVFL